MMRGGRGMWKDSIRRALWRAERNDWDIVYP